MLKNPLCKFFWAFGATRGVWHHIVIFAWWHSRMRFWEAAPIITYTIGVILGCNSRYKNKEINYRILIKYARDDIAWKLFRNNVTMRENKIQNFFMEFNGAWIENHLHLSSSKNRDMLSANLMENMHSIPIMECVVWLLQYLVIIVICVGVVFTLIFHIGTKESSTGEASDASGRELSLSVRRRMYVRCWLKTPQFYIVSLHTGHHF